MGVSKAADLDAGASRLWLPRIDQAFGAGVASLA